MGLNRALRPTRTCLRLNWLHRETSRALPSIAGAHLGAASDQDFEEQQKPDRAEEIDHQPEALPVDPTGHRAGVVKVSFEAFT